MNIKSISIFTYFPPRYVEYYLLTNAKTNPGACGVQAGGVQDAVFAAASRGHRDERHRHVGGGSGCGGAVHGPRHRRLPSPQGLRPASELNDYLPTLHQ